MQPSYFILWWAARLCKTFLALQYLVCRIIVFYCCGFLHLSAIKSPNFLCCCYNTTLRKRDKRLRCRFWYVCYRIKKFHDLNKKGLVFPTLISVQNVPFWSESATLTRTTFLSIKSHLEQNIWLKLKMLHYITTERLKASKRPFCEEKGFYRKKVYKCTEIVKLNFVLY